MAQNITIAGALYSDVPSIQVPKTGGGTASFIDTTIASNAASASDIASGKMAWVNGSLITGDGSIGGGITQDQDGYLILDSRGGGGGGTHSASGDITVVSDISITAEDPPVNFPGLQLPFQPDYLCLWYDLTEYKAAGSSAPSCPFIQAMRNQTTFPPFRITSSLSQLSACANSDYLFIVPSAKGGCSDSLANGYAMTLSAIAWLNLSVSSGWSVNSNGTLTVSYGTSGVSYGTFTISAGTWHYYALKG